MYRNSPEHVIVGTLFGVPPRLPELPPLIPVPEDTSPGDNMDRAAPPTTIATATTDWDTGFVLPKPYWPSAESDRRHSGWEEVERRWARQQQQQQQRQGVGGREQQARTNQQTDTYGITGSGSLTRDTISEARAVAAPFLYPHLAIPVPGLECDFRMRARLSSASASVAVGDGSFKKWTTFVEGEWAGQLGSGVVIGGGQDSQDMTYGQTSATQIEATHRLKTSDEIPAFIECKTKGFRTGPPEVMRALQDPTKAESVDARLVRYRVTLSMKTTDERYAEKVNFSVWVGSCLWRGSEVIYDAYKVT